MKKAIKFIGALLLLLIIAMIAIPYFFKDQLVQMLQDEVNKQVNATITFEDASLTLIRHFPNLTLSLEGLRVANHEPFEGTNLVVFESFDVVVGLGKVIQGELPEIKKVFLNKPVVYARVLEDGRANWDIMKEAGDVSDAEENEESLTEPTASTEPLAIQLNAYEIRDAEVVYNDQQGKMKLAIHRLTHSGKGVLGSSSFGLETYTSLASIQFAMEGENYLDGLPIEAEIDFNVDIESMRFTISYSNITMAALNLKVEGFVEMPDENIAMDLKFYSPQTGLKQLLGLVPPSYTGDLSAYDFKGDASFAGWVKGVYNETTYPQFLIEAAVNNESFHYAGLPESATDIHIDAKVELTDPNDLNSLYVSINPFKMNLGKNPIDARFRVDHPMTTLDMDAQMNVHIDLASLQDVMPLEPEETLRGKIDADFMFQGSLSEIEDESYEKLHAEGTLQVSAFEYQSNALHQTVLIESGGLVLSLDEAELTHLDARIGNSDFHLEGKLTHLLPYVLKGETLKGKLIHTSNRIDGNELMASYVETTAVEETREQENEEEPNEVEKTPTEPKREAQEVSSNPSQKEPEAGSASTATVSTAAPEREEIEKLIPGNIEFDFTSSSKAILYEEIQLMDFEGRIGIKNEIVTLQKCEAKTMGGAIGMQGSFYEIKPGNGMVNMNMNLSQMEIKQVAEKVEMVKKYAPIAAYTQGSFSSDLSFSSHLDAEFNPQYETVQSKGELRTRKVKFSGYEPIEKLAAITKTSSYLNNSFEDLDISFEIVDGKAFVKPFDYQVDQLTGNAFGSIDLEQNLDFLTHMKIPTSALGDGANQLMGQFSSALAGYGVNMDVPDFIEMDIAITGKADKPKFTPSISGVSSKNAQEQVKEKVKEEFDKAKEEATKRVKEEADKIIADAEKEAAKIMKEARAQADVIKKEAYKQADDLVKNAEGPFAKMGAEVAAKELKKQTDKQVENLLKEAQKQADKVLNDAKNQAARIK